MHSNIQFVVMSEAKSICYMRASIHFQTKKKIVVRLKKIKTEDNVSAESSRVESVDTEHLHNISYSFYSVNNYRFDCISGNVC